MSSQSGGNPQPAVFLSYARDDAAAVRSLAEALRAAGVEVWFDENELRGGEAWDRSIRKQIRDCALFVPVISARTQARAEGYFRLEWHLAEQRSLLIAKGRAFIVPVCIDDTPEGEALVPDAFMAVQWSRPGSEAKLAKFVAQVQRLLAQPLASARRSGAVAGLAEAGEPGSATPATNQPHIPDYELLRQIGRGSYGDVWLARGATGIWRAIKIVWRERFADAEPFEREWRGLREFAAISLGESSQMALLHVGRNDDAGFFYYVMELADDAERGRAIDPASYVPLTLTQLRARRTRLPADECVRYGIELARVLAGLHRRGLLHRDIKPSNVILVNGVPKLADIGLVAPVSDANTFVGTEGFVPAEGPGSPSADVFALGKVLYELATGLDRQEFPQLPPELNRRPDRKLFFRLNEIILRACEPAAAKRYLDASALLADLAKLGPGRSRSGARDEGADFAGGLAGGNHYRDRVMPWVKVIVPLAGMAMGMLFMFRGVWRPARRSQPKPPAALPAADATAVAVWQSVAVLPFSNLSDDKGSEYFSDGISEELLNVLAKVPGLKVSARTSAFYFKGKQVPIPEIAQKLGVAYVVEGSVRKSGGKIRITAQLSKAADGFQVWSDNFDRELKDIFAVQDEIAGLIAQNLSLKLGASSAASTVTLNPRAYELYVQGRQAWNLRTEAGFDLAESFFNRALALEPNFARAHAALADVWTQRLNNSDHANAEDRRNSPEQARILAKINQALALDPDAAEAHASLGSQFWLQARLEEGERPLRRAIALNPNYATAHQWLGRVLLDQGRMDEALAELKLATELDPLAPRILDNYGGALRLAGRFTAGLAMLERALAVQADSFQGLREKAFALGRLGRFTEAVALVRRLPPDHQETASTQCLVFAQAGLKAEAEALLAAPAAIRMEFKPRSFLALGRKEEAIASLIPRCLLALGLNNYLWDPIYDPIRNDPRMVKLLAGVGATEAHARAQVWRRAHPPESSAAAKPASAIAPAAAEKSLVVLPLENLSPDPENAFFTDGMHAEIIGTLARIPDLQVVSRPTALSLKGAGLSLGEAAKKTGAAHVMSGSVRRAGRSIRIQLELRRASDEALLWSQTYAQELTDPLALQSDIAENVARALQARESKGAFGGARFTTKHPQAFDLFLKARGRFEIGDFRGDGMVQAVKLLEEALALDPGFVSAASLLTNILADLARGSLEPAQRVTYAAEAKRYAEMAARLAPGGAGDAMLAFYYAVIEGEGAKALELADNAIRVLPNDAIHHNIRGIALSTLGRAADARQAYRHARELDPLTPVFRTNELQALVALRRWEEFEAAMAGDQGRSAAAAGLMVRARYELRGELPASLDGMSSLQRSTWLWLGRKLAEADVHMAEVRKRPPVADANRFGLLCAHHDVLLRLGRTEDAANAIREAREFAERLQAVPEVGLSNKAGFQAQLLIRLGRPDEAIAAGRRYVEEASSTTQTGTRWRREAELAEILAEAGRTRECVDLLAKLIRLPGTRITAHVLRLDPAWDKVRADARFQALLADPQNSAPW